jgi:tRNA pseudouridine38-40 synthase
MRTIKLTIEYDGTEYLGWQSQPDGKTIQGVLEETLKQITGERVHVIGSGRTDAGVHALAQVAHFKTESPIDLNSLQRALNSLLPKDILIKRVEEVDRDFHAQKKARSKVYEYRILNQPLRSVFHRQYSWHLPQKLDEEAMSKAALFLIGEHDFSSFRSSGTPTKTPVRKVFRAEWKKDRGGILRFEIEANGFLKQMVRTIVGTLVEVGKGKISPEEFKEILRCKDRKRAGPTAPPHGLFLKEVKY